MYVFLPLNLFSSNHMIFQLQGLFGMVPAMYVDLAPDRQSCIWTPSMWLTLSHVVSMEVTLAMAVMVMENMIEFTLDMGPLPTMIPLMLMTFYNQPPLSSSLA